jgi:hypothetical protein
LPVSKFYNYKTTDEDRLKKDRLKYLNEVMASIKGKEKVPSDQYGIKMIKFLKQTSI